MHCYTYTSVTDAVCNVSMKLCSTCLGHVHAIKMFNIHLAFVLLYIIFSG